MLREKYTKSEQGNPLTSHREVPCGGCSLYARRAELPGADFRLITDPASNQHMTVIRQAGQSGVNRDTMALVDKFLDRLF